MSSKEASGSPRLVEWARRELAGVRTFVHGRRGGRHIWRVAMAALGLVVVVAGIIMLVLPGPGWLVIFIGLGIWATEFAWAHSLLASVRRQAARWTAWAGRQPRWLWVGVATVCFAAVAAVAWLILI